MLSDIRSKEPIELAVAEFDRLGRAKFLKEYGFGESRSYFLKIDDRLYDSKAIVGVAHGYATGTRLRAADFSGGDATVRRLLQDELGYEVVGSGDGHADRLELGDLLTNAEIVKIFGVGNMGGMRRSLANNALVLISDGTQGLYQDRWQGDVLLFTGMGKEGDQPLAAQNKTLAESAANGVTIHLFEVEKATIYRYSGIVGLAGSHFRETQPDLHGVDRKVWIFPLRRKDAASPVFERAEEDVDAAGAFNPVDAEDAREKVMASIVRRRGQPKFRRALLEAYGGRCAVTNDGISELLEAAHIVPYKGTATNDVRNGLLLRTDIHTLFDLGLLAVDSVSMRVLVAMRLLDTPYGKLQGRRLRVPIDASQRPSAEALANHRQGCFGISPLSGYPKQPAV